MTRFVARTPEDCLAVVPVVLGFEPEESIVMLTFGGRRSFHARVDLPPPEEADACARSLLEPARHHGVAAVVFVLYGARGREVRRVARALQWRFLHARVTVVDVLCAHDGRWSRPLAGAGDPQGGTPYDVTHHPFRAQAVVDGRVVAASRADLAARLRADPDGVRAVAAALAGAELLAPAALAEMLGRHRGAATTPTDEEAAAILLAVTDAPVRDHAWCDMTRARAVDDVALWTDLVRRAPEGLVAGAAAVLGFAAWLHGDGALAWCAVDRCLADAPDHRLGRLVAQALEGAVAPDEWEAGFLGDLAG